MRTGWVSLHPDPTDPILLTPLAPAAGRMAGHMVQVGDTILGTWPDEFLARLRDTIDVALDGAPSAEVEPGGIRRPPAPSADHSAGPAPGDTDATARGSSFGDSAPAPASGRPKPCGRLRFGHFGGAGHIHSCALDVDHPGAHCCSCRFTWQKIAGEPGVLPSGNEWGTDPGVTWGRPDHAAGDPAHLRTAGPSPHVEGVRGGEAAGGER